MPKISQMLSPSLPLSGLELVPALQGGGIDANVGIPLLAHTGLPNGSVLKLRRPMLADLTATTDADPGAGKVRWNNAAPGSATILYINDADTLAASLADAWLTLAVGGFVYVQASADSDRRDVWQKWQITSVVDATGYAKIGVSLQSSNGTLIGDEALELTLQQPSPSAGVNRAIVTTVSSASGVLTLDASLGDYFVVTLTENITSIVMTNVPAACTLSLRIMQNATTARTVVFPASFLKRGGGDFVVPTTLSARHRMVMTTDNSGGSWDVDFGEAYS